MRPTIEVMRKRGGRWVVVERSQARATLAATRRLYTAILGEPVKCRWERPA